MRKIILILALIILLKPFIPIVEYVFNYEYISKVLCINKQKPIMHCNGKCYLMRQLAKSADEEKPISNKKNNLKEFETVFFQEIKEFLLLKTPINQKSTNFNYCILYNYLNSSTTFHPPTFIS